MVNILDQRSHYIETSQLTYKANPMFEINISASNFFRVTSDRQRP